MTTTNTSETISTTAVERILEAFAAGRGADVVSAFAEDAVLDATVPGWRFTKRGARSIAAQYSGWFADEGTFEELDRRPTPDGEVVTYLLSWVERGIPHAAHHCHVLSIDPDSGLVTRDQFFCGGRWDAATLAAMEEEAGNAG